jgi:mRNA interferase RelE/StbE
LNVAFKTSFARDIKQVRDKALLARLKAIIEQVERASRLDEIADLKKLHGADHYYRVRLGEFRIGLSVEGNAVTFVRFLHRKDVYRHFP